MKEHRVSESGICFLEPQFSGVAKSTQNRNKPFPSPPVQKLNPSEKGRATTDKPSTSVTGTQILLLFFGGGFGEKEAGTVSIRWDGAGRSMYVVSARKENTLAEGGFSGIDLLFGELN